MFLFYYLLDDSRDLLVLFIVEYSNEYVLNE